MIEVAKQQLELFSFDDPDMPEIDLGRCESKPINFETARNVILEYHYTHRVPSIKVAIGMYVDSLLAGCITYGTIPLGNAAGICGELYKRNVLELTRLFIHDWAGRNSESWFIGQSFKWLQKLHSEYYILISYADSAEDHVGYIYQATNWIYTGTSRHNHYQLRDGTIIQSRSAWNPKAGETAQDFYNRNPGARPVLTLPKHRYIYFLGNKRLRRKLRRKLKWSQLPYPKGGSDV